MSFSTLTADKNSPGSIKRWCNYAELDVEQVLEEAQALISMTLRVREMRTEFDLTLAAGEYQIEIPDGFLDPVEMINRTLTQRISLRDAASLSQRRIYDDGSLIRSYPRLYAIFDERFQFDCAAEEPFSIGLVAFKAPEPLSNDNQTNFLTRRYPNLLRVACLVQAYDFMSNGEKYQTNLSLLGALIENAMARDDLSYRGADFEVQVI
ncbi:MAG TPA: hypothetical protein VNZ94_00585 [Xanthobacteraceae bacterium]|nr:hypothetical protein [Xanthobacteraceae bacterium]